MKDCVIALSGRRGAGKSAIGQALADKLGWPLASFGDYIRSVARASGRAQNDTVLQQIGGDLVAQDVAGLVTAVLDTQEWVTGRAIVIDGIRHVEVLDFLRKHVQPLKLHLVHVEIEEDVRLKRLEDQKSPTVREVDEHSTEQDAREQLPNRATLVIDGAKEPAEVAAEVITRLERV